MHWCKCVHVHRGTREHGSFFRLFHLFCLLRRFRLILVGAVFRLHCSLFHGLGLLFGRRDFQLRPLFGVVDVYFCVGIDRRRLRFGIAFGGIFESFERWQTVLFCKLFKCVDVRSVFSRLVYGIDGF